MTTCTKPVIGAINGLCYGGGTVMATSLDFLIGCEKSSFRFLAVNYGQLNATWSLPNLVAGARPRSCCTAGARCSPTRPTTSACSTTWCRRSN